MNAVYARMFGDHRPARTTVQVAGLPGEGLRVEIDAIAYSPNVAATVSTTEDTQGTQTPTRSRKSRRFCSASGVLLSSVLNQTVTEIAGAAPPNRRPVDDDPRVARRVASRLVHRRLDRSRDRAARDPDGARARARVGVRRRRRLLRLARRPRRGRDGRPDRGDDDHDLRGRDGPRHGRDRHRRASDGREGSRRRGRRRGPGDRARPARRGTGRRCSASRSRGRSSR